MMHSLWAFLLTLGVLIAVHEWGHYRMARACGVKVRRFSIGFGPVIFRRALGPDATEFVLSAVPLGGYVRMLDESEGPVAPEELHRAYNRQKLVHRSAIVAAGPLANLLLAVMLYTVANWVGNWEPVARVSAPWAGSLAEQAGLRSGDTVQAWSREPGVWEPVHSMNDLRWVLTQAMLDGAPLDLSVQGLGAAGTRTLHLPLDLLPRRDVDAAAWRDLGWTGLWREPRIGAVQAGGPADRAGLKAGDRVLQVQGLPVQDATELRNRIRQAGERDPVESLDLKVDRQGQIVSLTLQPDAVVEHAQRFGQMRAELGGPPERVQVQLGPWDGFVGGWQRTGEVAWTTVQMFGRMLTGQASLKHITGPLTIADLAGQTVQLGLAYYLGFLAVVSVSLGVLNLMPLPMLDGGHLMYHAWEAVTGRPVPLVWLARLQKLGLTLVLLLMALALFNDLARLLGQS